MRPASYGDLVGAFVRARHNRREAAVTTGLLAASAVIYLSLVPGSAFDAAGEWLAEIPSDARTVFAVATCAVLPMVASRPAGALPLNEADVIYIGRAPVAHSMFMRSAAAIALAARAGLFALTALIVSVIGTVKLEAGVSTPLVALLFGLAVGPMLGALQLSSVDGMSAAWCLAVLVAAASALIAGAEAVLVVVVASLLTVASIARSLDRLDPRDLMESAAARSLRHLGFLRQDVRQLIVGQRLVWGDAIHVRSRGVVGRWSPRSVLGSVLRRDLLYVVAWSRRRAALAATLLAGVAATRQLEGVSGAVIGGGVAWLAGLQLAEGLAEDVETSFFIRRAPVRASLVLGAHLVVPAVAMALAGSVGVAFAGGGSLTDHLDAVTAGVVGSIGVLVSLVLGPPRLDFGATVAEPELRLLLFVVRAAAGPLIAMCGQVFELGLLVGALAVWGAVRATDRRLVDG